MGDVETPRLRGWHCWTDSRGATMLRHGRPWRREYRWRAAEGSIRRIDRAGDVTFVGHGVVVSEELLSDIWHFSLVAEASPGGERRTIWDYGGGDEQAAVGRWLAHHGGLPFRDARTGPAGMR